MPNSKDWCPCRKGHLAQALGNGHGARFECGVSLQAAGYGVHSSTFTTAAAVEGHIARPSTADQPPVGRRLQRRLGARCQTAKPGAPRCKVHLAQALRSGHWKLCEESASLQATNHGVHSSTFTTAAAVEVHIARPSTADQPPIGSGLQRRLGASCQTAKIGAPVAKVTWRRLLGMGMVRALNVVSACRQRAMVSTQANPQRLQPTSLQPAVSCSADWEPGAKQQSLVPLAAKFTWHRPSGVGIGSSLRSLPACRQRVMASTRAHSQRLQLWRGT